MAPSECQADIAVLASDINWTAYNNFGGRSNYIHPDRLPPTPTINARLQLNRYTDPEHVNYGVEALETHVEGGSGHGSVEKVPAVGVISIRSCKELGKEYCLESGTLRNLTHLEENLVRREI